MVVTIVSAGMPNTHVILTLDFTVAKEIPALDRIHLLVPQEFANPRLAVKLN